MNVNNKRLQLRKRLATESYVKPGNETELFFSDGGNQSEVQGGSDVAGKLSLQKMAATTGNERLPTIKTCVTCRGSRENTRRDVDDSPKIDGQIAKSSFMQASVM